MMSTGMQTDRGRDHEARILGLEDERDGRLDMRRLETKQWIKEAMKEWLSEQISAVGWWTFKGVAAMLLVALVYFIITFKGWKMPP
jgi:hypothetical protein